MSRLINRELLAGFSGEVNSYLPQIRQSFASMDSNPSRVEALSDAHRLVHSIKGAASMLGLAALSQIAFLEEEAIEEAASGQLSWNIATSTALDRVLGTIETYLQNLSSNTLRERPILAETVCTLRRLRGQPPSGDDAEIDLLLGAEDDPKVSESVAPSFPSLPASPAKRSLSAAGPVSTDQVRREFEQIPQDLLDTFREEADEILHQAGERLRRLEGGQADKQALLDLRRQVHTLKGAAASVGLRALSSLAHRMEDLLDEINQGGRDFSPAVHSLLFDTFDCLGDMAQAQNIAEVGPRTESLYSRFAALLDNSAGSAPVAIPASPSPRSAAGRREAVPIELMDAFRAETEEHLQLVGERLRALESDPTNQSLLQEIRRTVHTVKGASNMVGLHPMGTLAHQAEDLLDSLMEGTDSIGPDDLMLLHGVADALGDMAAGASAPDELLSALQARTGVEPARTPASRTLEPIDTEKGIDIPQAPAGTATPGGSPRTSQYVRVPIERLDELVRLVSELLVSRSTFEQYLASYIGEVDELSLSIGRLRRISTRIDTDFEVSALGGGFGQLRVRGVLNSNLDENRKDFDALEFDRYTDIHLISRDLNETTGDVSSAGAELAHRIADFDSYLNRLGRLTSEIQDKLMRMRMVPLLTLTTRLHRTVRVTAERAQKPVDLVIEGEGVELDKTVMEEIAAPLEHLLRNAVDHGIESTSTRRALGKSERGRVTLRAYHEGTQVVIQVSDDGGGIEPDLLRAAAVRMGLYSEADAELLSQSELYNLIFLPGFSTARSVSETSGRGVGMDVVKSTVNRMKGTTSVESTPGLGTKFTIRLPMTLAIMRVLLVQAHGETLAVPLSAVTQILRVEPQHLERLGHQAVIRLDGKVIPALRLGEALNLPRAADPTIRRLPVLILSIGDRRVALVVERLLEAREVVVKTMGTLLRRVQGLIGGTLMGDGSVVLIVNPSDLLPAPGEPAPGTRAPMAANPASRVFDVLIVDDSVSVRRVLSNLVRNTGWNPQSAKDGVEALEVLERGAKLPDVVLLDIEMPRMDGYELLSTLRAHETYKNLPVIMLTSRAGEKHRRRAFELGATDYLVKPYEEETLLTVIRRVVRESREISVA